MRKVFENEFIRGKYLNEDVATSYGRDASQIRNLVSSKQRDSRELLFKVKDKSLKDGAEGQFSMNGFEYFDYTPNLPLFSLFWQGQVPVRYGGGYAERVSAFRLNYQVPEGRIAGTKSNDRNTSAVKESKIWVDAYPLQFTLNITEWELMKFSHINYDVLGYKAEALRLGYQREVEIMAFMGNEGINGITNASPTFQAGLFNQRVSDGAVIVKQFDKNWSEYDINDFVKTLVDGAEDVKRNLAFNPLWYPNTTAIPPKMWAKLLQPVVLNATATTAVAVAMNYVQYIEEMLTKAYGKKHIIVENPYLDADDVNNGTFADIKAGGEYGKIVQYLNDERAMRFNITLPLTGGATYMTDNGYNQNFLSILTPLLVIYPTIIYFTNVAPTPPLDGE